jgi:uncharacterized protein (TIGR02246 family)
MKATLGSLLITVAISFPALAQQAPSDTDARHKVQGSVTVKVHDAWVSNDAAAYAKLFTTNGVFVHITGKASVGRQEIEQAVQGIMDQLGGVKSFDSTVDQAQTLPDGTIWSIGHATIGGNKTSIKDHWASVSVPSEDGRSIRMLSLGLDVTPEQTAASH